MADNFYGPEDLTEYYRLSKNSRQKPRTNADRIRAMSDEELAEYLDGVCHDLWQMFVADPKKMWFEWLRQEAADRNNVE